jgi:hypothetical protein
MKTQGGQRDPASAPAAEQDQAGSDGPATHIDPVAGERVIVQALFRTGKSMVASARSVREEIDLVAGQEAAPDGGLLAQLQALRDAQVPVWQQVVDVAQVAMLKLQQHSLEQHESGATAGKAKKGGKNAPEPLETMADEARERIARIERARRRQSLDALNASLANDRLEQEQRRQLEAKREEMLKAMMTGDGAQLERLQQSKGPWAALPYLSNDGRTLKTDAESGRTGTIATSGCGAVSLAMIVNFLDRENPEADVLGQEAQVLRSIEAVYRMKARGSAGDVGTGTSWNAIAGNVDESGEVVGKAKERKGALNDDAGRAGDLSHLKGNAVPFDALIPTLQSGSPVVWMRDGHYVVIRYWDPADQSGKPLRVADPALDRNAVLNDSLERVKASPHLWKLGARSPAG